MADDPAPDQPASEGTRTDEAGTSGARRYLRLLLVAAAVGIPVSLAAFGFLALLHAVENLVWHTLPQAAGFDAVPWWWTLPWLVSGGVLVGVAIRYLPGHGGHVPIDGMAVEPVPVSYLPGVLLAALAGLPLGAVLGPEAPLLIIGSAVALVIARWLRHADGAPEQRLVAATGAASALSAIFGSPLVAAVFIIEAAGLAGRQLTRLVLPCLLASGVGALIFTGVGSWSGIPVSSLSLPELPHPESLRLTDVLWTVPTAVVVVLGIRPVHRLGRWTASFAAGRPLETAVAVAAVVGLCAGAYALLTGRSPQDVALSGQEMLAPLATDAAGWSITALVALAVFKGLAYGVSLGALRGGAIFPAVMLGATAGVLLSHLPGFGLVPALAAGMAAATVSALRLPVASTVLVVVLLGSSAAAVTPIVLIAVVVGYLTDQAATARTDPA